MVVRYKITEENTPSRPSLEDVADSAVQLENGGQQAHDRRTPCCASCRQTASRSRFPSLFSRTRELAAAPRPTATAP